MPHIANRPEGAPVFDPSYGKWSRRGFSEVITDEIPEDVGGQSDRLVPVRWWGLKMAAGLVGLVGSMEAPNLNPIYRIGFAVCSVLTGIEGAHGCVVSEILEDQASRQTKLSTSLEGRETETA